MDAVEDGFLLEVPGETLDGVIFYDDSEKCFRVNGKPVQREGRLKAAHLSLGESFIGIIPL